MYVARQNDVRKKLGALLRLVLAICAWQGPLPYRHAHADRTEATEGSQSLAEHLRIWHGAGDACSDECLAGHWHFEYPHSTDDGEPASRPAKDRLATPAAAGARVASTDHGPETPSPFDSLEPRDAINGRLDPPGRNTAAHFFDGFAPTLSPPLRFGVARC